MNKLGWLKNRLSTISADSLRYRFATILYGKNTVAKTKACTFYWVILPTSAVGIVAFGAIMAIVTTIFWVFGYTPTFLDDKGLGQYQSPTTNYYEPGNGNGVAYRYKYHPRSGKTSRFAPWQLLLPLVAIGLLVFNSNVFLEFTDFLVGLRFVWFAIVLVIAFFYGVGRLVMHNRQKISTKWHELCPPLVVEEQKNELVS